MLNEPEITFVIPCMGRSSHVQQTLGKVVSQEAAAAVVVDYSDPDRIGDWVERQGYPNCTVARVEGRKFFNLSDSRNEGAKLVETPYVAFLDADVILSDGFTLAIRPLLSPEYCVLFQSHGCGYSGFMACWFPAYIYTGGYPVECEGYGYEDGYMREALNKIGVRAKYIENKLAEHITHHASTRAANYENKSMQETYNKNFQISKDRLAALNRYPLFGTRPR